MGKGKVRLIKAANDLGMRQGRLPQGRHEGTGADPLPAPKKPRSGSDAMRLANEVDRLQAELAAARSQVTELEARADIDPLLDILNRRGFERELRRSLAFVRRYGSMAALIYLDLDNFKPVNDRYGHAAGDRVLKAIAAVLQQTVRESDVVARLGGDEFGILLWNVSDSQAAAKVVELEGAVRHTVTAYDKARLSVGASAGFAMLGATDAPAEVISRADLAMYARKRTRQR
jgi:diguanylate cyclase (GGDEF)-like protein